MYGFSNDSKRHLETVDERLQTVLWEVIELKDFSVIEGYRNERRQNQLYSDGRSKLRWPESRHNRYPSLAVDIVPYPVNWLDVGEFQYLAGLVVGVAHQRGLEIRWGGDWDRDGALSNNVFNDLPHFEIVEMIV